MTNIILLVIIILLFVTFLKNFREGYLDYSKINEEIMKDYNTDYQSLNNLDCKILDNINTQKTFGKYKRMPCKSVDELKEKDECKQKVCEATPGCFVQNKKCLSVCGSVKGKDENELKINCEKQPDCRYDNNHPLLKERCFYQKNEIIPQTSVERHQSKCKLINSMCKNDNNTNCVQNLCGLNSKCHIKNKMCVLNTSLISHSLMNNPQGIVDKDSFTKDSGRYAMYPSAIDINRETVLEVKNPIKSSILDKIYNDYYKINNYSFNTFFDDVKDFTVTTEYCKKEKTLDWDKVKNQYLYLEDRYPKIKKIEIWKCDHINYNNDIEKKIFKLFDTWYKVNREEKENTKDLDEPNKNYNEMNNYNNTYNTDDFKKFYQNPNDEFNKQKQKMANIFSRDLKTSNEDFKSLNQDQKVEIKNMDELNKIDKDFYKISNNKNQNIIVQKEHDDNNKMPIVQQHIKGVGNIYAPEIIIR